MKKRAITEEQKREIIEAIYQIWISGNNHYLRLGQMLEIAKGNISNDLFYIEDYDLVEKLKIKLEE